MEFNMQMILEIVFSILGVVITGWVLPKLPQEKAKKILEVGKVVERLTNVAVENIEQRARGEQLTGSQKKELARNNAKNLLRVMGYKNINEEMIDSYIEASVGVMNFFRKDKNTQPAITDVSAQIPTTQE